jgi:hypothetical protein
MTLRRQLKRIEHGLRGALESFELLDGSTYYYAPLETYKELFLHAYDARLGDADKWTEAPELYRMLCKAKDPARAVAVLRPENSQGAFVNPAELFDMHALVNERRLVPLLSVEPPEDLSEP